MVTVDELVRWPTKISCFKAGSCHLMTDASLEELHALALRIGLRREWFQPGLPPFFDTAHYDLTPGRRAAALAVGAVFIPAREQVRLRKMRQARVRQCQILIKLFYNDFVVYRSRGELPADAVIMTGLWEAAGVDAQGGVRSL